MTTDMHNMNKTFENQIHDYKQMQHMLVNYKRTKKYIHIEYKQTDRQTDRQTNKQKIYQFRILF